MLLTSLSSMIGAILVPSAYLWLYSTHITLLCLYLIRTKRVLVLFLTLISLFAVWFSETQPKLTQVLSEQDRYFINLHQQKLLILTSDASLHEKVVAPALAIKLYLPLSLESHNTRNKRLVSIRAIRAASQLCFMMFNWPTVRKFPVIIAKSD